MAASGEFAESWKSSMARSARRDTRGVRYVLAGPQPGERRRASDDAVAELAGQVWAVRRGEGLDGLDLACRRVEGAWGQSSLHLEQNQSTVIVGLGNVRERFYEDFPGLFQVLAGGEGFRQLGDIDPGLKSKPAHGVDAAPCSVRFLPGVRLKQRGNVDAHARGKIIQLCMLRANSAASC